RREAAAREHMAFQHAEASGLTADAAEPNPDAVPETPVPGTFTREQPKVGRNEPCPCGSGKKYKQCHGKA
ncbi:MAG: SEC-C metal-binding domain-containing protein, partial [Planctomycetota bacterium]